MSVITSSNIASAMSYEAYLALSEQLFDQGKTTGPKQSESLTHYTGLNLRRMKRLHKTLKLTSETLEAVQAIQEPQYWVILTEAWCGDAAQILPILRAVAQANPLIELKVLLRDENVEIIDAYLTDGARSIPKVVMLRKSDLKELGVWGPRPAQAQELLYAHKAQEGRPYAELAKDLQLWYNKDKALSTQAELVDVLRSKIAA
ncbi:MAG: thioredoxin family protein [Bacteroidota bacterium]